MALITQNDLENRFSAEVVRQWTIDKEGKNPADIIAAAITKATNYVESVIKCGYPDVVPFSDSSVPPMIQDILLSIVGYRLAGRKQKAAEHYKEEYEQAETQLQALIQPNACLIMATGDTIYAEGSAEETIHGGGPWSSTSGKTMVFNDTALSGF